MKALIPYAALTGAFWIFAVFSMRAGNPTAINAVVGIAGAWVLTLAVMLAARVSIWWTEDR